MFEASWKSVIFTDQRIKDTGKVNVGILITGVNTTVLVVKLNSASNGLCKGETRGLGFNLVELLPLVCSDMLGNQAVLGCNVGQLSSPAQSKHYMNNRSNIHWRL